MKNLLEIIKNIGVTKIIICLEDYCYSKGQQDPRYEKFANQLRALIINDLPE